MTLHLTRVCVGVGAKSIIAPFTLSIGAGEITTLMGPSGSGKSSLLAYIAGDLPHPLTASGKVELNGVDLANIRPELRRVGRLFQDDLLFPHLTVGENLLFGVPRGNASRRRETMLLALQEAALAGFEDRAPHTLSGGQRARVSLMRTLLAEPYCMLLDEPFNKLDSELRETMRTYVFNNLRAKGIPCLLVTHDVADAPRGGAVYLINRAGVLEHA